MIISIGSHLSPARMCLRLVELGQYSLPTLVLVLNTQSSPIVLVCVNFHLAPSSLEACGGTVPMVSPCAVPQFWFLI